MARRRSACVEALRAKTDRRDDRADGLVAATPESIRELADSAMLLAQGAHRAVEKNNVLLSVSALS
jgi:hypothetical protein